MRRRQILLRHSVAFAFVIAASVPAFAQTRRMRVVDRDAPERGVQSQIFLIDAKDVSTRIDPTDPAGYFSVTAKCDTGFQIRAVPQSENYYAKDIECATPENHVPVGRKKYILNLKANAKILEGTNQTWDAALIYNELGVRLASTDAAESQKAKLKAIQLVGRTVGVDQATVYDPQQDKTVMTPELKAAVEAFQKSHGLDPTGVVDYRTLEIAAEKPISTYMYEVMSTE